MSDHPPMLFPRRVWVEVLRRVQSVSCGLCFGDSAEGVGSEAVRLHPLRLKTDVRAGLGPGLLAEGSRRSRLPQPLRPPRFCTDIEKIIREAVVLCPRGGLKNILEGEVRPAALRASDRVAQFWSRGSVYGTLFGQAPANTFYSLLFHIFFSRSLAHLPTAASHHRRG